jgi:hypothetical protein
MLSDHLIGAAMLSAVCLALTAQSAGAQSPNNAKYPDWRGQWVRIGAGTYDPGKRSGSPPPPLTAEYEAVWAANRAEEAAGGQYYNPQSRCLPAGMPRMMVAYEPMEIIISPAITYIEASYLNEFRRIYTDGRDWPKEFERSFEGYSIGHWEDTDGDGRYDTLVVETRGMKGPRVFDASGLPLHEDNETIVKERMALDKTNAAILTDEITTIDHALTRPWTITRKYRRARKPNWVEYVCTEDNQYVFIGKETYLLSADGYLMPTKKDQPPPDLRYFTRRGN